MTHLTYRSVKLSEHTARLLGASKGDLERVIVVEGDSAYLRFATPAGGGRHVEYRVTRIDVYTNGDAYVYAVRLTKKGKLYINGASTVRPVLRNEANFREVYPHRNGEFRTIARIVSDAVRVTLGTALDTMGDSQ